MSRNRVLTVDRLGVLADALGQIPAVTRHDSDGRSEAEVIAHALSDLEESCIRLAEELLPGLNRELAEGRDLNDSLSDIAQELHHVLYHVRDPKYFGYLFEDICEDQESSGDIR